MTYIKINGELYPASIDGRVSDIDWDKRESKSITLEMSYEDAANLFVDGMAWSIVQEQEVPTYDENGEQIMETKTEEYDNSDYCLAGDITDHRDGRITVKMGALTEVEQAYELMLGGM